MNYRQHQTVRYEERETNKRNDCPNLMFEGRFQDAVQGEGNEFNPIVL
jgi:hypothetical protein